MCVYDVWLKDKDSEGAPRTFDVGFIGGSNQQLTREAKAKQLVATLQGHNLGLS